MRIKLNLRIPLTRASSGGVRLMERDCIAQHTIVAGGDQACDPHCEGSGPLPAERSIIFDVCPRSARTRYFADMSRTVVKGRPSPELKRLYQTVKDAQEDAITKIRDGADGAKIHQGICERFDSAGFTTGLVNGQTEGIPLSANIIAVPTEKHAAIVPG
jgi:Xaa-Pro aminopeptidase